MHNRNIKLKLLLALVFGLLVFNGARAFLDEDQSDDGLSEGDLRRLTTVITTVKKFYYKSIDDNTLFTRAISGMLSRLDPHSEYLNEEALKNLEIMTWGKLSGVGVEVVSDQGLLKVISPIDDTPAYRAGIKSGDIIVQINNKLVRDMTSGDAVNMMRGKKGGLVTLTILRKSESKPLVFNLHREIIIKTVKERILEPGYGYVRLAAFFEPTERDMVKALKRLKIVSKKTGLKGLILDMRDNPGGLVESSVQIADDFLDARSLKNNSLIVYAKGQDDEELMTARATAGDLLPGVPIVVLIDSGSASAAEIVAGALQDHKRAIVVGTRSFGKGSMQTVIPIDKKTAIRLTTALYYTPLGRSIQAKGIEPDINIENIQLSHSKNRDQDMPRIDESTLDNHIKNADDSEESDSSVFKRIDKQQKQSKAELDLAYKDYQLYEALHILKSQNVTQRRGTD